MKKFLYWIVRHKIYTLIILIIFGVGGYFCWQKLFPSTTSVRYVTAKVERGILTTSVSGTGSISVSNQIDIKAKVSGDLTYVGVKVGQDVQAGQLLAQLNARDALKAIRDAEDNLETAKLTMEQLKEPADTLTLLQSENSLISAQESKNKAEDNLIKAYEDGFNAVANTFLSLPSIITGLDSFFFDNNIDITKQNSEWYVLQTSPAIEGEREKAELYKNNVNNTLSVARVAYTNNFDNYKAASRYSSDETIEALIKETYETTKLVADTIKIASNFVDYVRDIMADDGTTIPAGVTTHQSTLNSYTGTSNSLLSNLLSAKTTIQSNKDSIISAERSIVEKTESLAKVQAGPDALDVRSQNLKIKQCENSLTEAKEQLSDYYVRAPFAGIIATTDITKGDEISSGAIVATLITKQKIATITLNEVDIAKVKVGQRVIFTFDAIEDLTVTGEVAEVDVLGTASQGVVSYDVIIAFDIQDERVKSGMSISANIILESKPNVLMITSSAIKTQGGASYVEMLNEGGGVVQKTITTGISNDTMTEILNGVNDGDEIVTQKITIGNSGTVSGSSVTNSNSKLDSGPSGGGMMMMMR
ncbi:MAG: hypothetical protein COU29_03145 [Candidatus Magasanikbacteria bacterium CG10_big_fil_rev_8_21_14_0_10_36_32]|uniref:Uncharacterized protein n=1 Tax=Candidatus Magasanikbacteria bacterium CG10_big_fil_rev_8_21_14_0_10_36_32 TaxID=1974646 RepID=A0A2M6W609_9BACT|nr:MAG: hypothetical protein COU29_03145 [Candidatus Magasanikbacteria bacterium CG10_big_fil_rev_8_21_14_0_10_36_32]